MGLLDGIGAALGGLGGGEAQQDGQSSGILQHALASAGGLPAILSQLQQGGLAQVVGSWIGTGANQAVSGEQVQGALPDLVAQIAGKLGLDTTQVASKLAQSLPGFVDKLSPAGALPEGDGLQSALSGLLGAFGSNRG